MKNTKNNKTKRTKKQKKINIYSSKVPTHHNKKMYNCESKLHSLRSIVNDKDKFDHLIHVYNNKPSYTIGNLTTIKGSLYDHDAIISNIKYNKYKIPLISYNIEGLCDSIKYSKEHIKRLYKEGGFIDYFKKLCKPKCIICLQELFLLTELDYIRTLNEKSIKYYINNRLSLLMSISDIELGCIRYGISCILYDKSFFKLDDKLFIPRKNNNIKGAIYVKLKIKDSGFINIVNIHLKAGQVYNLGLLKRQKEELRNIIDTVLKYNKNTPIILVGDFNSSKIDKLIS
jgi:hypothetical protein